MKSITKWLTTGEMIDRLKVGEVAVKSVGDICVTRVHLDLFKFCTRDGDYKGFSEVTINSQTLKSKWRILPKYVTFREAMQAFANGKKIWCEYNGEKGWFSKVLDWQEREAAPSFNEILYGKWTIEGD